MTKKVVTIVCCILIFGTIGVVGLLYQSDDTITDSYVAQYRKVTQDFQKTQVSTEIRTPGVGNAVTPGLGDGSTGGTTEPPKDGGGTPPKGNSDATVYWDFRELYYQKKCGYANILIGASGKTVSSVGCALMSCLMMDEWNTQKELSTSVVTSAITNPSNFSKNRDGTPNASVYWDSFLSAIGSRFRYEVEVQIDKVADDKTPPSDSGFVKELKDRLDTENNSTPLPTLIHYTGKCGYYGGTGHFCLLVGYKEVNGVITEFYTADPSYGEKTITPKELANGNAMYYKFK